MDENDDEDREVVMEIEIDEDELEGGSESVDEGSVTGLDVETSCEVVKEEAFNRTRLVPTGAGNGSALAAQNRMAVHNKYRRERTMTSIYTGTPQHWRIERARMTHAAVSIEQLLVTNG